MCNNFSVLFLLFFALLCYHSSFLLCVCACVALLCCLSFPFGELNVKRFQKPMIFLFLSFSFCCALLCFALLFIISCVRFIYVSFCNSLLLCCSVLCIVYLFRNAFWKSRVAICSRFFSLFFSIWRNIVDVRRESWLGWWWWRGLEYQLIDVFDTHLNLLEISHFVFSIDSQVEFVVKSTVRLHSKT